MLGILFQFIANIGRKIYIEGSGGTNRRRKI